MASGVRVGCIGTGGIAAEFHLPALKEIAGVEIAALCDTDRARMEGASERFGGRVYSDHHEMIEREDLDALFVCVPPFVHSDAEVLAANKGIHLFVEKPVALDLEWGRKVDEAIRAAGIISCVGYQLRYLPVAGALRTFLADKAIALVAGNRWGGVPGDANHWWRAMDRSGGMLHEMATHNVDFIRYVVGEVARVCARQSLNALKDVPNLTVPDAQVALLEFRNGASGYFSASCALTKGGGWSSIDIVLRDVLVRTDFSDITISPEGAAEIELPPPGMSIQEAFIHAVRTGDRTVIRSDYHDALKTAEVTLGASESARTGRPVEMKL